MVFWQGQLVLTYLILSVRGPTIVSMLEMVGNTPFNEKLIYYLECFYLEGLSFLFFFFFGPNWQFSGPTTGSEYKDHSWQCSEGLNGVPGI